MSVTYTGNATAGLATYAAISSVTAMNALFDALLAVIPNPDAAHGTGAVAGSALTPIGAGNLDEMSPGCAAQLRAELTAAKTKANNTTIV